MSAEWWGEPADQRVRSASCGHVFLKDQLALPVLRNGNDVSSCPVCGLALSGGRADLLTLRDGVPASSSAWGEAGCRLRIQLVDRRGPQGSVANMGALLVRMSSPKTSRIDLPGRHLSLKPALLHRGPTSTLVLHARPSGCVIRGGAIALPSATVLMLHGAGAAFQGVSFHGGRLVCCGEACSVSFTGCVFEGCQLYAVHGAAVTARRCTHHAKIAVVACGAGSRVHLHACTFRSCLNAVTVEHGGCVSAAQCHISTVHAVIVHGAGSRATLHRCTIVGHAIGFGFMVIGGAVHMRHCSVENVLRGVMAAGESVVEVLHSHLESSMSAASIGEGARVLLRESDMLLLKPHPKAYRGPQGSRAAVHVCGPGHCAQRIASDGVRRPHVQIERCSVHARVPELAGVAVSSASVAVIKSKVVSTTAAAGIAAELGDGRVVLRSSDVHSVDGHGCVAGGAGSLIDIRRGCIVGGEGACSANHRAEVTVRSAWLCGARPAGPGAEHVVMVLNGAAAVLLCCTLRYGLTGVSVSNARAVVKDSVVSHMLCRDAESGDVSGSEATAAGQAYEVWGPGGELMVEGGSVLDCVRGVAVHVDSPGDRRGSAKLSGVCFTDNLLAIHVGDGGDVDVEGCQISLWERQADCPTEGDGLSFDNKRRRGAVAVLFDDRPRRARFEACAFVGYGQCIWSALCQDLAITRCSFRGGCERKALVEVQSEAVVEDCDFSGTAGGIAFDLESGPAPVQCTVKGCRFHSGIQVAIAGDGDGRCDATACSFEDCTEAITAGNGVSLFMSECDVAGAGQGITAEAAAVVDIQRCALVCTGVAVSVVCVRGRSACVTVTQCRISGSAGLKLYAGVHAVLDACSMRHCKVGVNALPGASVKVRESEFMSCDFGIVAGCDYAADADLWLKEEEAVGAPVPESGTAGCAGERQGLRDGVVGEVQMHGVDLVKCVLGVMVHRSGRLTASRVRAEWCISPFSAMHDCRACSFEECEIVGGANVRPGVKVVEELEGEDGLRELELAELPGISGIVAELAEARPTVGSADAPYDPML